MVRKRVDIPGFGGHFGPYEEMARLSFFDAPNSRIRSFRCHSVSVAPFKFRRPRTLTVESASSAQRPSGNGN
jgi:hypothetical protein